MAQVVDFHKAIFELSDVTDSLKNIQNSIRNIEIKLSTETQFSESIEEQIEADFAKGEKLFKDVSVHLSNQPIILRLFEQLFLHNKKTYDRHNSKKEFNDDITDSNKLLVDDIKIWFSNIYSFLEQKDLQNKSLQSEKQTLEVRVRKLELEVSKIEELVENRVLMEKLKLGIQSGMIKNKENKIPIN